MIEPEIDYPKHHYLKQFGDIYLTTMYRLTRPAISFSASSILLKERLITPLLSSEMHSDDRLCAIWDDLPWTFVGQKPYKFIEWTNFTTYELGVRRHSYGSTKAHWIMMNLAWALLIFTFFEGGWLPAYYAFSGGVPLERHSVDYGTEFSQKWHGVDVYCADGKYVRPFFHIFPPMYTMTVDDLDE